MCEEDMFSHGFSRLCSLTVWHRLFVHFFTEEGDGEGIVAEGMGQAVRAKLFCFVGYEM